MKPLLLYKIKGIFSNVGKRWDLLSPDKEHAIAYAYEHFNPEPVAMIDATHFSDEYVLAHYGCMINDRYREDREDDDDKRIAEMVSTHITKAPHVLYRGVGKFVFSLMIDNAKKMPGIDLYEKSFLQTSLVKGQEAEEDYHLRIYVPAGAAAVYLGNVNDEQDYYEVVLRPGYGLKIVSADKFYINCLLVL